MLITPNNILNILKIFFFFFYLNASFVSETEMQPDQFNAWQYLYTDHQGLELTLMFVLLFN